MQPHKLHSCIWRGIIKTSLRISSFYVLWFQRQPFSFIIGRVYHYENKPIQNILKILPPKIERFQMKNSKNFHISAQNIDCGYSLEPPRRGGSNEYTQSMF